MNGRLNKLEMIDEYLRVSGWMFVEEAGGWLPPESCREIIAVCCGAGHYRRDTAIAIQVRIDEHHAGLRK